MVTGRVKPTSCHNFCMTKIALKKAVHVRESLILCKFTGLNKVSLVKKGYYSKKQFSDLLLFTFCVEF